MDLLAAIKERRSVRSFLHKDLPNGVLEEIIGCGILAPSAGNTQPWGFIIVRERQRKKALSEAALSQDFIEEAPVVIVVLADQARSARVYGRRGSELYSIQDTAAAIQNMLLTAHGLGLGACWVGAFDEGSVAEIVKAPRHAKPVAMIPIGYPSYPSTATPRRNISEVVHDEVYQT